MPGDERNIGLPRLGARVTLALCTSDEWISDAIRNSSPIAWICAGGDVARRQNWICTGADIAFISAQSRNGVRSANSVVTSELD